MELVGAELAAAQQVLATALKDRPQIDEVKFSSFVEA
jgi:hypothetical protein